MHRAGEAFTLRHNLTTPAVAGMVTAAIFKHMVLFATSYEVRESTKTPQKQIALSNEMIRMQKKTLFASILLTCDINQYNRQLVRNCSSTVNSSKTIRIYIKSNKSLLFLD
jgi:hypothetical protein